MGKTSLFKRKNGNLVYLAVNLVLLIFGWLLTQYGLLASAASGDAPSGSSDWSSIWVAIGTGLIATGVAGIAMLIYYKFVDQQSARLRSIEKAGIIDLFDVRGRSIRGEYDSRLAKARSQVDIIGFGLSNFRDDHMQKLLSLSARASVRILLIAPESPYTSQRDKEEGQAERISREVKQFVTDYIKIKVKISDDTKLKTRLYTSLPYVNVFRIDDELFWGPYLTCKNSGNTMTHLVSKGCFEFDQIMAHFEDIWTNDNFSREIDPDKDGAE